MKRREIRRLKEANKRKKQFFVFLVLGLVLTIISGILYCENESEIIATTMVVENNQMIIINNKNVNKLKKGSIYYQGKKLLDNGYYTSFKIYSQNNDFSYIKAPQDYLVAFEIKEGIFNNELIGSIPEKNNEVVISQYLADLIISDGIKTDDNEIYIPSSYEEIISDTTNYALGDNYVKIVGILKQDIEKYSNFKTKYISNKLKQTLFDNEIYIPGHFIYVNSSFITSNKYDTEDSYILAYEASKQSIYNVLNANDAGGSIYSANIKDLMYYPLKYSKNFLIIGIILLIISYIINIVRIKKDKIKLLYTLKEILLLIILSIFIVSIVTLLTYLINYIVYDYQIFTVLWKVIPVVIPLVITLVIAVFENIIINALRK